MMMSSTEQAFGREAMLDIFGPMVNLPDSDADQEYVVIRSIVPPGVVVPLHSHGDRETIVVTGGRLEAWLRGSWAAYETGEIIEIPSNEKHALRNGSASEAHLVLVTTPRMGQFFRDISAPVGADVSAERLGRFFALAEAYGYWNGDADEQAAVGIAMPDV
ncbi:cupin domain-containing protein [Sphingomonas xinjiangensis]|uniref:Quercetin dioxygenase-like cupin family protein n=1 Tax=Sphingomonas xinjiangensis TaxID=643568 RepID=A0A840YR83_9SPHN|nr:cupin domain-containing protein [Sphingomonas xinjiangensis]MBB5711842.1 quercetin dioxygenase-like cupin family protein [Sphingomonas xinjiangensis]